MKKATKKAAKKATKKATKKTAKKVAKKAVPATKIARAKRTAPAKKKKAPVKRVLRDLVNATVTMWEPIMPVDRGERYEEPLLALLGKRGDIVGAGSGLSDDGEIEYVDIELELDDDPALIDGVIEVLEVRGAPKHSRLSLYGEEGTRTLELGVAEGVGIYFDGTGLAPEVYRTCGLDDLCARLEPLLAEPAEIRGSWQGPKETALYLYGLDAEALWSSIEPAVRGYPLAQGARVVVRLGHADGKPRVLRL